MALIKNLTSQGVDLVVRGDAKNGVPPTGHVEPGQTRDLDVDVENARIKGMIIGGAIAIIDSAPASRAASPPKLSQSKTYEGTKQ